MAHHSRYGVRVCGAAVMLAAVLAATLAGCRLPGQTSAPTPVTTPVPVLITAARTTGVAYAAIGASDAYGIGTDAPQQQSWPAEVARQMGPRVHLIDLGIPGATAALAQRIELPVAEASAPQVVTILLGVNDIEQHIALVSYLKALDALILGVQQTTDAQIYVGNIPDLTLFPYFRSYDSVALGQQVQDWNAAIATLCAKRGVRLVDVYATWGRLANHPNYLSKDGLHPSAQGAAQLAQVFAQEIELSQTPARQAGGPS